MRWWLLCITLAGCGRLSFDSVPGDAGDPDAVPDAPNAEVTCQSASAEPTHFDQLGMGTPSSPYAICNAGQLVDLMQHSEGWTSAYSLGADLDLTGLDQNSAPPIKPIGTSAQPFRGTFAGGGHTIANYTFTNTSVVDAGLFGFIDGNSSTVHDLVVAMAKVSGDSHVGALAGRIGNGVRIERTSSSGAVTAQLRYAGGLIGVVSAEWAQDPTPGAIVSASSSSATVVIGNQQFVGGLIGVVAGQSVVTDCYATGNVVAGGGDYVGGLIGGNEGLVLNSYSTGDVSGDSYVGGLSGSSGGTYVNSYSTSNVTGGNGSITGKLIGESFFGSELIGGYSLQSATCTAVGNCHAPIAGETVVASKAALEDVTVLPRSAWSSATWSTAAGAPTLAPTHLEAAWGSCAQHMTDLPFAGGSGTLTSPFLICAPTQLAALAAASSTWGNYQWYALAASIDLAGTSNISIGSQTSTFHGFFDGRGHTIAHYHVTSSNDYVGLFGQMNGRVERLGMTDVQVSGGATVGAIVGGLEHGSITDSYATGSVTGASSYVGGIAGAPFGPIERTYFVGSVTGYSPGGLIGLNNCSALLTCVMDSVTSSDITASMGADRGGPICGECGDVKDNPGNYYDSSRACTNCAFLDTMQGENYRDPRTSQTQLFDMATLPLSTWDFTTTWTANAGSAPTLRVH